MLGFWGFGAPKTPKPQNPLHSILELFYKRAYSTLEVHCRLKSWGRALIALIMPCRAVSQAWYAFLSLAAMITVSSLDKRSAKVYSRFLALPSSVNSLLSFKSLSLYNGITLEGFVKFLLSKPSKPTFVKT